MAKRCQHAVVLHLLLALEALPRYNTDGCSDY